MIRIAPSLLSADFGILAEEIARVEAGGADLLHIDVMDGRFVPNLAMGLPTLRAIRKRTRLPLDLHLMIVEPEKHLEAFAAAGADFLTVHVEASPHLHRTLGAIRELGARYGHPIKAGVALNPATPPDVLEYVRDGLDLVVVMSVNPGFGGQPLIPAVVPKIRRLRALLEGRAVDISLDGGVEVENAAALADVGASILVAGSAIFEAPRPAEVIAALRRAAERAQALRSGAGTAGRNP